MNANVNPEAATTMATWTPSRGAGKHRREKRGVGMNVTQGMATPNSAVTVGQKTPPTRRRPSPEATVDLVLTVLLLALFAWAYLEATQWSFRASLFPRVVAGLALVLTVLHLVQAVFRLRRSATEMPKADRIVTHSDDTVEPDEGEDDAEHIFRTAGTRGWAAALGWVTAFFVLLYLGGLFVTASLFSFFYLRFAGRRTWVFSAIYAVVIGAVLYTVFEVALSVATPTGLLLD